MMRASIYVISTLVLFCISTIMLYYVGEKRLDVYFSIYLLIYMITTEIILPIKRRYRKYVNIFIAILFVIFMVLITRRVIEILGLKL